MRNRMLAGSIAACAAALVTVVHGQGTDPYDVEPTEKGRKLGVSVYRVHHQQPAYAAGSDYEIEIVDRSQAVVGTVQFKERPSGVTTLTYTNVRTGRQLEAKYGPGYRWLELRDPQTGQKGRTDFVENGDEKPSYRKNTAFRKLEAERKDEWEQMFEAATAVSTFDARRKEKHERQHGPTTPMKPRGSSVRGVGLVLASAASQSHCGGMASCRGVSFSITKSSCCAAAKQSASNCCGMNQYCIGCCAFGSCDSYCAIGDYACAVCGVSGTKCSAPVQNCYGNVACPPNYMCSGTGCIPMF